VFRLRTNVRYLRKRATYPSGVDVERSGQVVPVDVAD
jgi:hypothetical protein